MKWLKHLKFLCLAVLAGFLMYCGTQPAKDPGIDRPDGYYDERNKRDGRDDALDRSKKRYTGPKCEGDEDCEDICKDIYRHNVRDECEELAIDQVEILEQIDEIFENPKERELSDIDAYDFETYVSIDLAPFDKRVGKLSSGEVKRVLTWIVENQKILEIFREVDDEYDLLKDMLKELGKGDVKQALEKSISGSDSLLEIGLEKEEEVIDWLQEYFAEECDNNRNEEICILKEWYCEFNLNADDWDSLVSIEKFEVDIANEILSSYCVAASASATDCESGDPDDDAFVPGGDNLPTGGNNGWWQEDVENTSDLNEPEDLEDLCDEHLVSGR